MEVPFYLQHTTGALPAQPDFIDELPPSQEAEVRAYAPFYPFSTKKNHGTMYLTSTATSD